MPRLTLGLRLDEIPASVIGSGGTNTCFTTVLQSGDWVGSDEPATNIEPPTTSDGTLIYSFRANIVSGEWIMRFGASGDEKLENVSVGIYEHGYLTVALTWDPVNLWYDGDNLEAALELETLVGTEHCFKMSVVPDLLQKFSYEFIETETV